MPRTRDTLSRAFDTGLATTLLLFGMAAALWFASQHWHEQAWTIVGLACVAVLSALDLRRHRRHADNERLLASIQQAVPDILFFKDTQLRYRAVNRAFADAFGLAPEHALGLDDRALFGEALHARFEAQDRALLASREAATFEESMEIGGEARLLRARKQPVLDARGRAIGIVGLAVDVTEERRLQRSLVDKAEEARVATEAKGQFLATMSHEIRTPMNGVLGMVDLLAETPLDAEQRLLLARCRESSVALLAIIDDILDFSKIEAGKLALEARPLSLRALAEGAAAALAVEARRKGIALEVSVDAAVPRDVVGDAVRLRQVLLNLLGNALKFTERGRVALRIDLEGDAVRLQVEDTGIGIAPDALRGLFRPFEQADAATTRRFGGTGLGLSIVKRLAELMGGDVACESTPGVGSRFIVRVPLPAWDGAPEVATQGARVVAALPRGLHALLAEDHPINRDVIVRQLARLGWTCDCAEDGEAAWTHLHDDDHAARYAVLLTDCHMPNLDGYDLVRRLRLHEASRGRARLPVLALTANALQGERERCMASGMDAYLSKPLQVEDLQHTLATLVVPREGARPYAFLHEVCAGDAEAVVALLRTALATSAEDIARLRAAAHAGDARAVRDLAHRLVSVARQLDEPAAADALSALQAAAGQDDAALHAPHADAERAFHAAIARARAFIETHAPAMS